MKFETEDDKYVPMRENMSLSMSFVFSNEVTMKVDGSRQWERDSRIDVKRTFNCDKSENYLEI